jgi:hypothetical protein
VFVALVIQHAERMRRIMLSSVASLALLNFFSTLAREWNDNRNKVIEHKMCVLIFSTTFGRKKF